MLLNPKYEHLRTFIGQIPDVFEQEGTYIYGGRRNLIKSFHAPDGTILNVKRFQQPRLFNRLVYSLGLRRPKGLRAWLYPQRLQERGIETPEPVAYIEERRCGLLGLSFFISIQCPYERRLYEFGDALPGTYEEMAEALGGLAARMHNAGVLHRDFSPGNVLWMRDEAGFHFSLVDINRMRFGAVSCRMGCRNFSRLWGPLRFFQLMARAYARQRGFDEQQCEQWVLSERAAFWRKYVRKHGEKFRLEL